MSDRTRSEDIRMHLREKYNWRDQRLSLKVKTTCTKNDSIKISTTNTILKKPVVDKMLEFQEHCGMDNFINDRG
jgi:hypothetical protein